MNAPLRNPVKFDVHTLVEVIKQNTSRDGFSPALTPAQWDILGSYLQPQSLTQGQVLIEQNGTDRALYLVEEGNLSVHYEDSKGRLRIAVIEPGSAVGEGAFFTGEPRSATVQAGLPSKLWCLTPLRFTELSNRKPEIALEIAMALGSLVSRRLVNKPKRAAVT
jgi:CRP/FNR family transcriptional regulator, cyclic AMP receptor protein